MDKSKWIGERVGVLDHGFVELVDVMGSDAAIAEAARVSYKGAKRNNVSSDEQLIDYLIRHLHTSPTEMGVLKFIVKLPIFVERQWVRHRTCSMNEISARYSQLEPEFYEPAVYRQQDQINKQGSAGTVGVVGVDATANGFHSRSVELRQAVYDHYDAQIKAGVANELARIDLPVAIYTEKYWMMNLHNLLHFLKLRTDHHAQWEIRQYAAVIEDFVKELFPATYSSWVNHVRDAVSFSVDEFAILKYFLGDVMTRVEESSLSKSRKAELMLKLRG